MKEFFFVILFIAAIVALVKIRQMISVGANKVIFSGTNKRGKEQVARVTQTSSQRPPYEVMDRFASFVQTEAWPGFPRPKAVVQPVSPDQLQVQLRGCTFALHVVGAAPGSRLDAEVLRWRTVDGVIQGVKEMDRLHQLAFEAAKV